MSHYKDAEESFLQMIELLSNDLAEYSGNPNAKPGYIKRQERLISVMKRYHEKANHRIRDIYMENNLTVDEYYKLKLVLSKFELICLMHGIIDVQKYMAMTAEELISIVKELQSEKMIQTPFLLNQNPEQNL